LYDSEVVASRTRWSEFGELEGLSEEFSESELELLQLPIANATKPKTSVSVRRILSSGILC
jgi:hypothetical protein